MNNAWDTLGRKLRSWRQFIEAWWALEESESNMKELWDQTLNDKISKALAIIEKRGANLHDDTYLDKIITGLEQELSKIPECSDDERKAKIEFFLKRSSIEQFLWRNFDSEESQLQDFVFRLIKKIFGNISDYLK